MLCFCVFILKAIYQRYMISYIMGELHTITYIL